MEYFKNGTYTSELLLSYPPYFYHFFDERLFFSKKWSLISFCPPLIFY
jgi:hypothetical protein